MPQSDIVIVSAARTPVGSFSGSLASVPAHELGRIAIDAAVERAGIESTEVDEVILGQVLTAGQGQNPARQAAMAAGIPKEASAWGINQVLRFRPSRRRDWYAADRGWGCAHRRCRWSGEHVPIDPLSASARRQAHGRLQLIDTMIKDGLWDAFNGYHMGVTAENVAEKFQITRDMQDAFAVASQNKAEAAQNAGRFDGEISPVTIKTRKGEVMIDKDEYIRHGATLDTVSGMRPAFDKDGKCYCGQRVRHQRRRCRIGADECRRGKIARPHTSGTNCVPRDGAGVDPAIMGTGPIPASKRALERAGWNVQDLDLIEANEAFAAQACAVNQEMGWDTEKGTSMAAPIAIGHPIGASGARILVTLLHEMQRRDAKKGLATLCIGGGMGVAMCVER